MASATNPLRSLLRCTTAGPIARGLQSSIFPTTVAATVAPFSTTTAHQAVVGLKKKSGQIQTTKQKANFKKKKGQQQSSSGRKPNTGERKAFRKRVQLSNNSAIEVKGTEPLTAAAMADAASAGRLFAIPDALVDQLRTLQAFKPTQSWGLFRKPHVLLRAELVELMAKLKVSAEGKEAARVIVRGSRLSGKSLALLQAMSYALLNNWVVINIPEANDLTNGNTEYSPIPDTEPALFSQPVYTLKFLQDIYAANKKIFDGLKVEKDWSRLNNTLGPKSTLTDLIQSCKESEFAWPTFSALWTELTLPGRPPVLLALDGLSHINKLSDYRDSAYNLVHAHDLTLIRTFVDALSGTTPLPNGGAVLAALSESGSLPRIPSQELALDQLEAVQAKRGVIPGPDRYQKGYDDRVYDALKTCQVFRLEGIVEDDAKTLLQYWGASGMFRGIVNMHTVKEKWALAGHGNIGEMERASLMTIRL